LVSDDWEKSDKLKLVELGSTKCSVPQVMGNLDYKGFSLRHRPHISPPDATLFVTYRLAGSIPQAVVRQYRAKREWLENQIRQNGKSGQRDKLNLVEQFEKFKREWFVKFEEIMDRAADGPMWLGDERVNEKVKESLHGLDGQAYRLDCYSIMSNHVHVLLKLYISPKQN